MRIRHILLKEKYQAEDVLRLLKAGGDFAELAKKWSQCPSARDGGDLGEIQGKKLDEDFSAAAEALPMGGVSGVVRTRFGYHLIRRDS